MAVKICRVKGINGGGIPIIMSGEGFRHERSIHVNNIRPPLYLCRFCMEPRIKR
jgi:hypothetical protein